VCFLIAHLSPSHVFPQIGWVFAVVVVGENVIGEAVHNVTESPDWQVFGHKPKHLESDGWTSKANINQASSRLARRRRRRNSFSILYKENVWGEVATKNGDYKGGGGMEVGVDPILLLDLVVFVLINFKSYLNYH